MSGHSHYKNIKRVKEAADKERSRIFSKMARKIAVAARKSGDPEANPDLRMAIEKAKSLDVPKGNIEKAIKRGTGELKKGELEEFVFEAMGPGEIRIIIEGITDNKNRTLNEIRQILRENKGKLVQKGAVNYLFEKKGVITLRITDKDKEDLELKAIEAGADDLKWREDSLEVIAKIEDLKEVKENLEKQGVEIESVSLDWVEKKPIEVPEKTRKDCEKLFEILNRSDDILEIYSNLKA